MFAADANLVPLARLNHDHAQCRAEVQSLRARLDRQHRCGNPQQRLRELVAAIEDTCDELAARRLALIRQMQDAMPGPGERAPEPTAPLADARPVAAASTSAPPTPSAATAIPARRCAGTPRAAA